MKELVKFWTYKEVERNYSFYWLCN